MVKSTPTKTTPASNSRSSKKTKLAEDHQLSWTQFQSAASPLKVHVQGKQDTDIVNLDAGVKEFSSGSYGWSASKNAKIPLKGHKEPVDVIISLNITVKGSKPKDGEDTPTKPTRSTPRSSSIKGKKEAGGSSSKGKKRKLDESSSGSDEE